MSGAARRRERAAGLVCGSTSPLPARPSLTTSALAAVGVWQGVFFIALRGWPVNALARRAPRLLAGNVLVIVPGAVTYLVLRDLAGWRPSAPPAAA
ncbi:hypothetical protein [Actinomadura nitritigenes]|uniref:hypothetical protein n=1 Tax=Actinomadura nitritigenes TaxID=134602 RepID=UPI003D9471F3